MVMAMSVEEKVVGRAQGGGHEIIVEARPEPLCLDLSRTALLVIDMQNDFGAKGGMFDRAGIDIDLIQGVVDPIREVKARARDLGVLVVYLAMGFLPDLSDAGPPESLNRVRAVQLGAGCEAPVPGGGRGLTFIFGDWGTEILPELAPEKGDLLVRKTRFSGFFRTELDDRLKQNGIDTLIVTGCTTSICVESTVRDAMIRDYKCLVLDDCTAEKIGADLPRTNHEASLLTIETLLGWVSSSQHLLAACDAARA